MRIAIIGASGGIGRALCVALCEKAETETVYAISRSGKVDAHVKLSPFMLDILDEAALAEAATRIKADGPLDMVLVATGFLSDDEKAIGPEKSWREQSLTAFEHVFAVNTFGPGLVAKHFLPLLARKQRVVFAALSARVGSISDNRLGGWHAYRASKAALNMLLRNYALELGHRNDEAIVVGLHPGTVATELSSKFTASGNRTVFTPDQSVDYLLNVIDGLIPAQSGKVFDWKGEEIPA